MSYLNILYPTLPKIKNIKNKYYFINFYHHSGDIPIPQYMSEILKKKPIKQHNAFSL